MKKRHVKILATLVASFVVFYITFIFTQKNNTPTSESYKASVQYPASPLTLNLWVPEPEKNNLDSIISDFKKVHPNVSINIEVIDNSLYQTRINQAVSSNSLPDMAILRSEQLPQYKNNLKAAPDPVFTTDEFRKTFADLASNDLISGNSIIGAPLGLATLGLIYNQDRFFQASILGPPATWVDFNKTNSALRKKESSNLYSSGVALGTPLIRNYPDIISVLMMQNGAAMTNQPPTKATFEQPDDSSYYPGSKALEYYASFSQPTKDNYSWSDSLGDSVLALGQNKTALIIDYPMAYKEILAKNPNLNLKMSQLPQVNPTQPLNYGTVLVGGVFSSSTKSDIAWDFWNFATSKYEQNKFSLNSYWPASRKDLIKDQLNDKDLSISVRQSSTATNWYEGNNYQTNASLREMCTSYLSGIDSRIAVNNASSKVTSSIKASLR
ncbi:MAG: extracellular solute-binding protein [Candidatus Saccharibacteria bacterium]